MPSSKKLTPGDCDNGRNRKQQYRRFGRQFLVVDRCRNHLVNLLSSSALSKISNLALELRRYLPEFQRYNYFRFRGHIDISGCRLMLYLLANTIFQPIHGLIPQICRWNFHCTCHRFGDISISGFGRHFRLSVIIGIS